MKAQCGPRVDCDLAQRVVVFEYVDDAELIEIEAGVRLEQPLQNLRANVDVFRADEIADATALVTLFHLVPPAIDLVANHCGFFDKKHGMLHEVEQAMLGSGNRGKELPAGKDADTA